MADLTSQELAAKLRGERFKPGGPEVGKASDPVADTAMVITLDELRPYELNPRIVRNPRYDDIKASIRERGLEAAPPITRRAGEAHYIIRNGGNTRLSILNELWQETKDERFFRISCLFRPWTARGEILALTGHLAENELRGELTFIERALGVEKLRELYERREAGRPISQKELADRLRRDGYPIGQSHISRMQDAIRHLLPSMPKILYGGLGRHQIERLIALRRGAQRIFERHATKKAVAVDFDGLFHDVSAAFDLEPATFNAQRLQDELIGQMASLFGADYDALMLALVDAETWQQSLLREPAEETLPSPVVAPVTSDQSQSAQQLSSAPTRPAPATEPKASALARAGAESQEASASQAKLHPPPAATNEIGKRPLPPGAMTPQVAAPVQKTPRGQGIEGRLTQVAGEIEPPKLDSEARHAEATTRRNEPQSFAELWDIAPALDEPKHLRERIGALAREIAHEAHIAPSIEAVEDGIGFICDGAKLSGAQPAVDGIRARATVSLLWSLSSVYTPRGLTVDGTRLVDDLAPLLQGMFPDPHGHSTATRVSDEGVLKLFRLIRLARRLVDLESGGARTASPSDQP